MIAQGFRGKSRAIEEVPEQAAKGWRLSGGIGSQKFAGGCIENQIAEGIARVEPTIVESGGGSSAAFAWTLVMPNRIPIRGREVISLVARVGNVDALAVNRGGAIIS